MNEIQAVSRYPEVIERFDNNDLKLVQKWFEEKLAGGCSQVNILAKLDMAKVRQTEVNAFFENNLYSLRYISDLGHIAVVAHSKFIKTLVPIDNLFF
ncbi:STAS/SEC14 domain-containing protein [Desulforhopalus vacuolatus]|uniref:STAS/SEC14 domain-containing protein n=1 Tax=Desulforhopalus vacuolatus TaxID=40414 RepID=UPI00196316F6|nr:STAS/SEC14 domain-containing protein [Desulforhopalus vacuolatus]MBM9520257.1 STAS/SEC14 domain-containing protein [Desulforhopalus vacuolatus]